MESHGPLPAPLLIRALGTGGRPFQMFTPGATNPAIYIDGNTAYEYNRAGLIISGNYSGTGQTFQILRPTADQTMLAIWADVNSAAMQIAALDVSSPNRNIDFLYPDTLEYVMSILVDGSLSWGASTFLLQDTRLGRGAAGALDLGGYDGSADHLLRVYGLCSSSKANYERLVLGIYAGFSTSDFSVITENGGTGAARALLLGTAGNKEISLVTNSSNRFRVTGGGQFISAVTLAVGMTTGFMCMPGAAGAPSGVPASPTGFPYFWDSTNKKLYVYDGGWKKGQVAGVDVIYA